MAVMPDAGRDVESIVLSAGGRVVRSGGVVDWQVLDGQGLVIVPIERYLRDFVACGNSQGSVRSYAFVLLRWWRFLAAVGVSWDRATAAETRDLVLWMLRVSKPRPGASTALAGRGGVNPVTRKRYLDDRYQPRTIRHNNAVLRSFYQYWMDRGDGPLLNPVPLDRARGPRANTYLNPLEPFRAEGRLRYNPPVPKRSPRAMPDERWDDLFGSLRSDRDRALLALAVSTGPGRASFSVSVALISIGVSSLSVSGARAVEPSSGCRPARTRSCGYASTSARSGLWIRTSPCGGRCGADAAMSACLWRGSL